MIQIHIPTVLRSYTDGRSSVGATGGTIGEILADLDRQFPGLRFRMVDERGALRQHMVVWIDGERCRDLTTVIAGSERGRADAGAVGRLTGEKAPGTMFRDAGSDRRAEPARSRSTEESPR